MGVGVAEVTAVITCMTDGERPWVREAIASVARQTQPTAAIVCVADSNTWIEEAVAGLDADLTVLRLPMAPSGEVRNAGVQAARTDLVAFLDGDDAWAPTKVARQVDLLRKHSLDLIATKHVMIRDDGVPFFYAFADRLPMTSSWLGRRELFVQTQFSSLLVAQDVELWHRLVPIARMGVADAYLLRYRVRAGSRSQHTPSMRRKLRFERLSRIPLLRFGLLAASRVLNIGLDLRRRVGRGEDTALLHVR